MNVAIPTLEQRVSPVFDVAQTLIVVELEGGRQVRRQSVALHSPDLARRAATLAEHGVDLLICGAISLPLQAMLAAAGIQVIPQTCGAVEDVLRAFVAGRLNDAAFLMPGCCGRRRLRQCGLAGARRGRGQGRNADRARGQCNKLERKCKER